MLAWRIWPILRFAESQNRMSRRARLRSRSGERVRASSATLRALVCVLLHFQASSTLLPMSLRWGRTCRRTRPTRATFSALALDRQSIQSWLSSPALKRDAHELTRLESSGTPSSVKEHLRQQLDARRKMARKPHVLRLAELYAEAQTRELFSRNTRH